MSSSNNSRFSIRLPIFLTLAVSAGILIGATMADGDTSKNNLFTGFQKFREILTYVERDYVDEVNTEKLVEEAIEGVLDNLDPHSVYIPAEDLEVAKSQLEGEFDGIGIEFNIVKDTIYVVAPLSGGPSEEVGLQSGDKIVKVDGEVVAGTNITNGDVFNLLRGPKGSEVEVSIKRNGRSNLVDYTIMRDKIPQYSIDVSYMVNDKVGYVKISRFSATTHDEFKSAVAKLKKEGMQKLILDLQNNPGGYMDRAVNIVDEMLADNKLIVYTKGKQSRFSTEARAYKDGMFEKRPVIVLIDEGSASASEIVSGALQDNDRALIVGRRSYGKGLVQLPITLSDESELRLTISRYYTPSGRSIQKPYDDTDEYGTDILKRFEHGEFFHADSIEYNDSLKYKTLKGRTVYGGGGITPDYFVALDTSMNSAYLGKLSYSNTLREYTYQYVEDNRKKLERMSFDDYYDNFEVTDKMLDELIALGNKNKAPYNEEHFQRSKELIKIYVKAFIARGIWKSDGFYPIFNETNEIFQQALKLFPEAEKLVEPS